MVDIMENYKPSLDLAYPKAKKLKLIYSRFSTNTPLLHNSNTPALLLFHVGITQIATDVPITNNLNSHLRVFRKPVPFEHTMDGLAVDLGFQGGLGYVSMVSF